MITTLSLNQISNFLINTSNGIRTLNIPRNNQTFHRFIPMRYVNTKRFNKRLFSPFLFQCFYFIYQNEINENISDPKIDTDVVSIPVKFNLKSTEDVYIVDAHDANKYFKSLKKRFNDLMDDELIQYYYLIGRSFKTLDEYIANEDNYIDKIYLLQRPVDYNNEIVEIYHKQFNDILLKVNDPNTYKPIKKTSFIDKIKKIFKIKSKLKG